MSGKFTIGSEPVIGLLTPSKKRDYRVTNRLQEGKRPLYAVVFNFIDSRYFNVFATVGGNRVRLSLFHFWVFVILTFCVTCNCIFFLFFVLVCIVYVLFKMSELW